ncbi:dATP/dGTP diphosphohydrolase domain-containing protein [Burkholderia sp. DN3021]|uniref:dATP/dGTP diphosphohydrolase domain-containing protein n=1 Tax=Burkholderia sp. DN3021 TaxID=3410137 RepID=UPI003C7C6D15
MNPKVPAWEMDRRAGEEIRRGKFLENAWDSPVAMGHPCPPEIPDGSIAPTETALSRRIKADAFANPKQAFGDKKPPLHLIHPIAELHESAALHSGRRKYGENNYLETAVEAMTYLGAILRHTKQFIAGERVDQKELVHHLGAVKACCTILLTAEACGTLIDNRPVVRAVETTATPGPQGYRDATAETFAEVERTIEHLNKLYPEPK